MTGHRMDDKCLIPSKEDTFHFATAGSYPVCTKGSYLEDKAVEM
jgi:hypothetical protein